MSSVLSTHRGGPWSGKYAAQACRANHKFKYNFAYDEINVSAGGSDGARGDDMHQAGFSSPRCAVILIHTRDAQIGGCQWFAIRCLIVVIMNLFGLKEPNICTAVFVSLAICDVRIWDGTEWPHGLPSSW